MTAIAQGSSQTILGANTGIPPQAPCRQVTEAEKAAFARDGAVVLKNIFEPMWLERMAEVMQDVLEKSADGPFVTGFSDPGREAFFSSGLISTFLESARDFIKESPAAAIAGQVSGAEQMYYYEDQAFYRAAGPVSDTFWHQDIPYWKTEGDQLVRLWIPLDEVKKEVALCTIRGSHRWGVTYRAVNIDDVSTLTDQRKPGTTHLSCARDSAAPAIPCFADIADSVDLQQHAVEPGDALAISAARTVHGCIGSDQNYGQRRVISTVFAGEQMVYHDRKTTNPHPDGFTQ